MVPPPKTPKTVEPEKEKTKLQEPFQKWLADAKKNTAAANPFETAAPVRQNYYKRPDQAVPIEKTAESFFTNMIRTYKKPDGKAAPKVSK